MHVARQVSCERHQASTGHRDVSRFPSREAMLAEVMSVFRPEPFDRLTRIAGDIHAGRTEKPTRRVDSLLKEKPW